MIDDEEEKPRPTLKQMAVGSQELEGDEAYTCPHCGCQDSRVVKRVGGQRLVICRHCKQEKAIYSAFL